MHSSIFLNLCLALPLALLLPSTFFFLLRFVFVSVFACFCLSVHYVCSIFLVFPIFLSLARGFRFVYLGYVYLFTPSGSLEHYSMNDDQNYSKSICIIESNTEENPEGTNETAAAVEGNLRVERIEFRRTVEFVQRNIATSYLASGMNAIPLIVMGRTRSRIGRANITRHLLKAQHSHLSYFWVADIWAHAFQYL